MAQIASLEVYRGAIVTGDVGFHDYVTSAARDCYDEDGNGIIIASSSRAYNTVRQGMYVLSEEDLRYHHYYRAGDPGVKHFGKKITNARTRLEFGSRSWLHAPQDRRESSTGNAPIGVVIDGIAREHGIDASNNFISVQFDTVNVVEFPDKYPRQRLFVLAFSDAELVMNKLSFMLSEMSRSVPRALSNFSDSRFGPENVTPLEDGILFARTSIDDKVAQERFIEMMGKLLPMQVELGSVELRTNY